MGKNKMKKPILEHFVSKVLIDNVTGCFNWLPSKNVDGYGIYKRLEGITLAHRASYKLFKGDIPEGLCVCHRCDNPSCVNPEHLFLGTVKDNNRDAVTKGRNYRYYLNLTHCKNGHELNDQNKILYKDGRIRCKICYNNLQRNSYHRRKKSDESR